MRQLRLVAFLLLAVPAGTAAAASEPGACPVVPRPAIAVPRLAEAAMHGGAVRIVAFGSSSTAGAGASLPWRAYPSRLETLLRRGLPNVTVTVMNRGAGGEDVANMIGRMDADVIAERPDLVIWQAGANAALRRMDPARFRAYLFEGLARLRREGIHVVLMDNQRAPRIAARPGHEAYDAVVAEAAATLPGVSLFSRGALMDALAAAGIPNDALLVSDGLHHNDRGYACVAEALARGLLTGAQPLRAMATPDQAARGPGREFRRPAAPVSLEPR
nr:SGNH/GDSL hydrolase family protein [Neoroseomonas soli]